MARPTFLVLEPEPPDALSTRKLVLETAKFNVITAHSTAEAIELLENFHNVQALIVVATMNGCSKVVRAGKALNPALPVILLAPNPTHSCKGDHYVSTHDPEGLVVLMRTLFGDPRKKS
jgi:DNA-binding response OmpR family regulator